MAKDIKLMLKVIYIDKVDIEMFIGILKIVKGIYLYRLKVI